MIEIIINITEKDLPGNMVGGRLDIKVNSQQPSPEEVSLTARVMEKLRELAQDISNETGAAVNMEERIVDVRHFKPGSGGSAERDRGKRPGGDTPKGEGGGSSPPKK